MAYIGNKADTAFTSLIKQDLTGASGTSLVLSHAVANANDIALYINNVRQEPISAYSTNGTAVTLTGSVVSSDDIYVIYLARAVQTTVTPDGSVSTAKLANSAVSTAKIASSAVNLTSKVTGILPLANGGTGHSVKHAFYMYRNPAQSVGHASGFNLIQLNNSRITEGGGVTLGANARYTVPSGGGGIYILHCQGRFETGTDGNVSILMRLNGTPIATTYYHNGYYDGMNVPMLRSLSDGDYVDVGVTNSLGSTVNVGVQDNGDTFYFFGYRLG